MENIEYSYFQQAIAALKQRDYEHAVKKFALAYWEQSGTTKRVALFGLCCSAECLFDEKEKKLSSEQKEKLVKHIEQLCVLYLYLYKDDNITDTFDILTCYVTITEDGSSYDKAQKGLYNVLQSYYKHNISVFKDMENYQNSYNFIQRICDTTGSNTSLENGIQYIQKSFEDIQSIELGEGKLHMQQKVINNILSDFFKEPNTEATEQLQPHKIKKTYIIQEYKDYYRVCKAVFFEDNNGKEKCFFMNKSMNAVHNAKVLAVINKKDTTLKELCESYLGARIYKYDHNLQKPEQQ